MITAHYSGREAEYIKAELLKAYLEPLLMIIGQQEPRVCFIDCFSGPWQKGAMDPGETSVGISLDIMEKCYNELSEKFRKNVHLRGLFIERDKEAFGRLKDFLKSESWGDVDAYCLNGDFYELRNEILSWCGDRDFCLFLIDPAIWRDAAVPTLLPLLGRPSSEFLINFALDPIFGPKAKSGAEEHAKGFFRDAPDISNIPPEEREGFLFNRYCQELKACASTIEGENPRCAQMRILYPNKERTVYGLAFLTWSPAGVVAFMEASGQFEMEQRRADAQATQARKFKRSRQIEMFSAEKFAEDEPRTDTTEVKEYWLSKLSEVPRQFGVAEFADMLEETGWFVDYFQRAFLELEREGKVRNLGSTGMRTENPVHYWANGNRGELLERA
jgi:three-Cys-motif partner protein